MNFFGPRSLSHVLFYVFRALALLLFIFLGYVGISFLLGNFTQEAGRFYMNVPLMGYTIKGDYQTNILLTIFMTLVYGAVFIFLLSNIFRALKKEVVFNTLAVKSLKQFTILNLVVGPFLYVLIHFFIMRHEHFRDVHNLILHLIFGIIALFLTHVFKRGMTVQLENDLTI